MTFESARILAAERYQEVRDLLTLIPTLESADALQPDPEIAMTVRGLFHVSLYGYFEKAINDLVNSTLEEIVRRKIPMKELHWPFYSVALNGSLQALAGIGREKRWTRRRELFEKQQAAVECDIPDGVFSDSLMNVGWSTLVEIFTVFGVPGDVVPRPEYRGYLVELVENRNAVAHGREAAAAIGRRFRSDELAKRLAAVAATITHVEFCLMQYVQSFGFVDEAKRPAYIAAHA